MRVRRCTVLDVQQANCIHGSLRRTSPLAAIADDHSGHGHHRVGQNHHRRTPGRNASHWPFADADDFHSAANKEKMHQGIPLTDADREPWLAAIRAQMLRWAAANENGVITCSALKQSYRDFLTGP